MVWLSKPPLGTQIDWSKSITKKLAGCWLFNEGMGDKIYDLSSNANTGTLKNISFPPTTSSGWNPGRTGTSLTFNRTTNYVNCGNSSTLLFLDTTLTLEAFVKFNSISSNQNIIRRDESYLLGLNGADNKISFFVYGGGGWGTLYSNSIVQINTWYHIVGTYNITDKTFRLYINGVLDNTSINPRTNITNENIVYFGVQEASVSFLGGIIEYCRIWNRALTQNEVTSLYTVPYGMFIEDVL